MTSDETCPQCLNSLTGYASRLVQDSCGHQKCRRCLLDDENGCRTCENNKRIENSVPSILEQQLYKVKSPEIKQNTNVIRFHQNDTNFQHVSVVKSSNNVLQNKIENENDVELLKLPENSTKTKSASNKKPKEVKNVEKTVENKHKCDECKQEFRRRSHLEWHMRRHTGERPFVCQICGKSYTQKAKLNRHSKIHTDERSFACGTCDKSFHSKTSLLSHSRIHSGEKPYSCSECSTKFSELSNLKKHLTIHTKEKPFMCADCGARFSLKWRLTVHLRVHSRERPFVCIQCQRGFNNLKDLRRHEITHSSEKPFVCVHCSTHFRRKDNLERHIKNTHYDLANGKLKKEIKFKEKTEEKAANCLEEKSNNISCLVREPNVNSVIKSGSDYVTTEPSEDTDKIRTEPSDETFCISTKLNNDADYISTEPTKESKSEPLKIILGPPKLACKKKEFKDKFEIGRQVPNVYIYQKIYNTSISGTHDEEDPRKKIIQELNKNSNNIIKQHQMQPLSVPSIHYETSFESVPHATIENIKFKLPADYTSKISKLQNNDQLLIENETDNVKEYTELKSVVASMANVPIITDNQNYIRTSVISKNLNLKMNNYQ